MRSNSFGQVVLNTEDAFEALYSGKVSGLENILFDNSNELEKFNFSKKKNFDNFPELQIYKENSLESKELFDEANRCTWFMPKDYLDFPMHEWLLDQCKNQEEKDRVNLELELFIQHNMYDVLFYLKYLVDTMRQNQIVWGVGRGSSVASFVLYLLGVHRINSIKYELDINEFLK